MRLPTPLRPHSLLLLTALTACAVNDRDGDGFGYAEDCNDSDPEIHPDAADLEGDGVDQDCDGQDALPLYVGSWALVDPSLRIDDYDVFDDVEVFDGTLEITAQGTVTMDWLANPPEDQVRFESESAEVEVLDDGASIAFRLDGLVYEVGDDEIYPQWAELECAFEETTGRCSGEMFWDDEAWVLEMDLAPLQLP